MEPWMILGWTIFTLGLYALIMPRTRPAPVRVSLPVSIDYDYEQAYNAYHQSYAQAYAQYQSSYYQSQMTYEERFQIFNARMDGRL